MLFVLRRTALLPARQNGPGSRQPRRGLRAKGGRQGPNGRRTLPYWRTRHKDRWRVDFRTTDFSDYSTLRGDDCGQTGRRRRTLLLYKRFGFGLRPSDISLECFRDTPGKAFELTKFLCLIAESILHAAKVSAEITAKDFIG